MIGTISFERLEYFKYFRTILRVQYCIHEEIKRRLKSGSVCYHLVQNLLSSTLLPRNLTINIYSNVIFSVVLCGDETWFLILKEKFRLSVFENRVSRRYLGLREMRLWDSGKIYMRSFMIYTTHQILFR
jgi:hypothetical protein